MAINETDDEKRRRAFFDSLDGADSVNTSIENTPDKPIEAISEEQRRRDFFDSLVPEESNTGIGINEAVMGLPSDYVPFPKTRVEENKNIPEEIRMVNTYDDTKKPITYEEPIGDAHATWESLKDGIKSYAKDLMKGVAAYGGDAITMGQMEPGVPNVTLSSSLKAKEEEIKNKLDAAISETIKEVDQIDALKPSEEQTKVAQDDDRTIKTFWNSKDKDIGGAIDFTKAAMRVGVRSAPNMVPYLGGVVPGFISTYATMKGQIAGELANIGITDPKIIKSISDEYGVPAAISETASNALALGMKKVPGLNKITTKIAGKIMGPIAKRVAVGSVDRIVDMGSEGGTELVQNHLNEIFLMKAYIEQRKRFVAENNTSGLAKLDAEWKKHVDAKAKELGDAGTFLVAALASAPMVAGGEVVKSAGKLYEGKGLISSVPFAGETIEAVRRAKAGKAINKANAVSPENVVKPPVMTNAYATPQDVGAGPLDVVNPDAANGAPVKKEVVTNLEGGETTIDEAPKVDEALIMAHDEAAVFDEIKAKKDPTDDDVIALLDKATEVYDKHGEATSQEFKDEYSRLQKKVSDIEARNIREAAKLKKAEDDIANKKTTKDLNAMAINLSVPDNATKQGTQDLMADFDMNLDMFIAERPERQRAIYGELTQNQRDIIDAEIKRRSEIAQTEEAAPLPEETVPVAEEPENIIRTAKDVFNITPKQAGVLSVSEINNKLDILGRAKKIKFDDPKKKGSFDGRILMAEKMLTAERDSKNQKALQEKGTAENVRRGDRVKRLAKLIMRTQDPDIDERHVVVNANKKIGQMTDEEAYDIATGFGPQDLIKAGIEAHAPQKFHNMAAKSVADPKFEEKKKDAVDAMLRDFYSGRDPAMTLPKNHPFRSKIDYSGGNADAQMSALETGMEGKSATLSKSPEMVEEVFDKAMKYWASGAHKHKDKGISPTAAVGIARERVKTMEKKERESDANDEKNRKIDQEKIDAKEKSDAEAKQANIDLVNQKTEDLRLAKQKAEEAKLKAEKARKEKEDLLKEERKKAQVKLDEMNKKIASLKDRIVNTQAKAAVRQEKLEKQLAEAKEKNAIEKQVTKEKKAEKTQEQKENTLKKLLKRNIKREQSRLKGLQDKMLAPAAEKVDADEVARINDTIQEHIDRMPYTVKERNTKLKEFYDWRDANPNKPIGDFFKPVEIAKLSRPPIDEMSEAELREAIGELASITEDRINAEAKRKGMFAKEHADDVKKISKELDYTEIAGSRDVNPDIGRIERLIGETRKGEPAVLDLVDQKEGTTFQEKVSDPIYNESLNKSLSLSDEINEKLKKIYKAVKSNVGVTSIIAKFTYADGFKRDVKLNEALAVYAYMQNERGKLHIESTYTPEEIKMIMDNIPKRWKQAVDEQLTFNDEVIYPMINDVFKKVYGVTLPKENKYFTITGLDRSGDINNIAESMINNIHGPAMNKGILKERTNSKEAFRTVKYFNTLARNVQDAIHFVSYAENIQKIGRILNDATIRKAMNRKNRTAADQVRAWFQAITVGRESAESTQVDSLADSMRSKAVVAILAGLFTALAKQSGGYVVGAFKQDSIKDLVKATARAAANPYSLNKMINEKSVLMRSRSNYINSIIADYNEQALARKLAGKWSAQDAIPEAMMNVMATVDKLFYNPIWYGKYLSAKRKGASEKEAIIRADALLREVAPFGGFIHNSTAFRGGGIKRAYSSFLSPASAEGNMLWTIIKKMRLSIKNKDIRKLTGLSYQAIGAGIAAPLLMVFISNGFDWEKIVEDPYGLVDEMIRSKTGMIPFVNIPIDFTEQAATNLIRSNRGIAIKPNTLNLAPVAFSSAAKSYENMWKNIAREDYPRAVQKAVETVGYVTGAATLSVSRAIEGAKRISKEGWNPSSAKSLVYGPTANKSVSQLRFEGRTNTLNKIITKYRELLSSNPEKAIKYHEEHKEVFDFVERDVAETEAIEQSNKWKNDARADFWEMFKNDMEDMSEIEKKNIERGKTIAGRVYEVNQTVDDYKSFISESKKLIEEERVIRNNAKTKEEKAVADANIATWQAEMDEAINSFNKIWDEKIKGKL